MPHPAPPCHNTPKSGCPAGSAVVCLPSGKSLKRGLTGSKPKEAAYKRASAVSQTADEDALSCVFIRKHGECIRYLLYTTSFGLEPSPKRRDFPEGRQTTADPAGHPSVPHYLKSFFHQANNGFKLSASFSFCASASARSLPNVVKYVLIFGSVPDGRTTTVAPPSSV